MRSLFFTRFIKPIRSYTNFTRATPITTTTIRTKMSKSKEEWRAVLNKEQFRVLREQGTEAPFTGKYNKTTKAGTYHCVGCDAPLYKSTTKFQSGCGWPAFFDGVEGAIKRYTDVSHGMTRIEIRCSNCDGHLGHVFKGEGYKTPTDERHCVNSVCLNLKEE